ncbi:MAG: aldolase, partial [Gammaproteobacteria bacterium]|nr:aldolase [Gammaproteobacteria bacterium]
WIYRKRPDVRAIVHTHPPHASALAATGGPLRIAHMDSSMLYGTAHLPEWPGVPVADDEG